MYVHRAMNRSCNTTQICKASQTEQRVFLGGCFTPWPFSSFLILRYVRDLWSITARYECASPLLGIRAASNSIPDPKRMPSEAALATARQNHTSGTPRTIRSSQTRRKRPISIRIIESTKPLPKAERPVCRHHHHRVFPPKAPKPLVLHANSNPLLPVLSSPRPLL